MSNHCNHVRCFSTIEIPLYHILNACVTFGNLYGGDAPAYGVVCDRTATPSTNTSAEPLVGGGGSVANKIEPTSCVVEDCVFDVGRGYHLIGTCLCCNLIDSSRNLDSHVKCSLALSVHFCLIFFLNSQAVVRWLSMDWLNESWHCPLVIRGDLFAQKQWDSLAFRWEVVLVAWAVHWTVSNHTFNAHQRFHSSPRLFILVAYFCCLVT